MKVPSLFHPLPCEWNYQKSLQYLTDPKVTLNDCSDYDDRDYNDYDCNNHDCDGADYHNMDHPEYDDDDYDHCYHDYDDYDHDYEDNHDDDIDDDDAFVQAAPVFLQYSYCGLPHMAKIEHMLVFTIFASINMLLHIIIFIIFYDVKPGPHSQDRTSLFDNLYNL